MTHGSLFSGIGGFDLASEWMGWQNIFHCDNNEDCLQVLKYYWPDATSYTDIKLTDFTVHRGKLDVLTGGFPCQPASSAGKRKGTKDDRWLWPEMLRAIREIQPRYVVAENVRGLLSLEKGLVFDTVLADLETEGYEVLPFLLPACAINAPHRRDRIWIVAHSNNLRGGEPNESKEQSRRTKTGTTSEKFMDATSSNTIGDGHGNQSGESGRTPEEKQGTQQRKEWKEIFRERNGPNIERTSFKGIIANANTTGSQRRKIGFEPAQGFKSADKQPFGHNFFPRQDWQDFPTVSPLRSGDDGLSSWLVRAAIQGFGNSIVPQLAKTIFEVIEENE